MKKQLERIGGMGPNVSFFNAQRPESRGEFPSLGARGCFESQLAVLRQARDNASDSVLIIEDDFDFVREGPQSAVAIFRSLSQSHWDIFYGAHLLDPKTRVGLACVPPEEPVLTASFVGFHKRILPDIVEFLEQILERPAGSPEFGPMHVDGAYTVFRQHNLRCRTVASFPPLGKQRRSRSDITPSGLFLDRWSPTRKLVALIRRGFNWVERR